MSLPENDCLKVNWRDFQRELPPNSLSVMTMNAHSLSAKSTEFVSHLALLNNCISFVVVTETWLDNDKDVNLELDGYKSVCLHRNRYGGGIKVFYLEHIDVEIIRDLSSNDGPCEKLFLDCFVPRFGKLTLGSVYRPPDKNLSDFFSSMTDILNVLNGSRTVLAGDFNLNTLEESASTSEYMELMTSYGFVNAVSLPTFVSSSTFEESSCIDHIWYNMNDAAKGFVIEPNLSDHYAVSCVFSQTIETNIIIQKFRDFSSRNVEAFLSNADSVFSDLNPVSLSGGVELQMANFVTFLQSVLHKYFPIKTRQITKKRLRAPWITSTIIRCIDKKHKWHQLLKRKIISRNCYKECCCKLRYILNLAEKEYFIKKLNSLAGVPRKNWKVLSKLLGKSSNKVPNKIIHNTNVITDKTEIANRMNSYFVEKPIALVNDLPDANGDYLSHLESNPRSMQIFICTPEEIVRTISEMKKSCGLHDIPTNFLKLARNHISGTLAALFNVCISHGKFPDSFKIARVIPIHKKQDRCDVKNYRPISTLPNLSKIFETLLHRRLKSFLKSSKILHPNQFGFREGKSTELAVMNLVDRALPAIENKGFAICIFLDFTSCFDTISREILYKKLYIYGIRGLALELVKSYFSGRKQQVCVGEHLSDMREQHVGVIQGSKMGPLFFDLYSNDMNKLCHARGNILFADDTCLIFTGDNLEELSNNANAKLALVYDWCCFNKLTINPSKSEYVLISNCSTQVEPLIHIGGNAIQKRTSVKYLGVHIDDRLKYHSHVDNLKKRMSQLGGISYRLKGYFNLSAAKNYYYSCVYSLISYCISAWGGTLACYSRSDSLKSLHKRIVKNLFGKFFPREDCIFKAAEILKIEDVHRFSSAVHMFKLVVLKRNEHLQNIVPVEYPQHRYATRNRDRLVPPFPRVQAIRASFKFQLSSIWNNVDDEVASSPTLNKFKKNLKVHIINSY